MKQDIDKSRHFNSAWNDNFVLKNWPSEENPPFAASHLGYFFPRIDLAQLGAIFGAGLCLCCRIKRLPSTGYGLTMDLWSNGVMAYAFFVKDSFYSVQMCTLPAPNDPRPSHVLYHTLERVSSSLSFLLHFTEFLLCDPDFDRSVYNTPALISFCLQYTWTEISLSTIHLNWAVCLQYTWTEIICLQYTWT